MMEWLALVAEGILGLIGFAVLWGKSDAKMDSLVDRIESHDTQHVDHYKHAANADVHWTVNERADLNRRLDEMGRDLKELLRRGGQ